MERHPQATEPAASGERQQTVLLDLGADPMLGYALACSVAWHARRPTLLIVAAEDHPRPLQVLYERIAAAGPGKNRAYLRLVRSVKASTDLDHIVGGAAQDCGHVLIQIPGTSAPVPPSDPVIHLSSADDPLLPGAKFTLRSSSGGSLLRPDRKGMLHVPAPLREDESGFLRGLLPPTTPMGRALGWAARDVARLKVGLALGAGSSLGYAHIGALGALAAAQIPIDYIAGASVGSCIAALHAAGYDHQAMAEVVDDVGPSSWRPTLPRAGLLSMKPLRQRLRQLAGDRRIEDLPVPLAIVAADIAGKREVVFRAGPIWPALLASIAIPGVFPPQRIGPHVLVDGGVVNPVPADIAAEMGADVVIAVKLLARPHTSRIEAVSGEPAGPTPAVFQTIMRSIEIMQSRITAAAAEAATIQIAVDCSAHDEPGLRHFSQGRRFIPLGDAATRGALPRLAESLPWIAPPGRSRA